MNATEVEAYKPFLEDIKVAENWLKEAAEQYRDFGLERKECLDKVKDIEISWEAEKFNISKLQQEQNALSQARKIKEVELANKRLELEERIYQDTLKGLMDKQPKFEEALRGQVKAFADSRFSGLSFEEEDSGHEAVAEGIIKRVDNFKDFSQDTVEWRGAKGHYEKIIENLCAAKIKGKQLTANEAHYRFQKIIECLRVQETRLFR